jgi:hypothetical protein
VAGITGACPLSREVLLLLLVGRFMAHVALRYLYGNF